MHIGSLFRRLPFALISRSRLWLYFYQAVAHAKRWPMRIRQTLRLFLPPVGEPLRLDRQGRYLFLLSNPSVNDIRRIWKKLAAQGFSERDIHFVSEAADVPALQLGGWPHTTLQSIWTDTAVDIRIYNEWYACRQQRLAAVAADGLADELLALEPDYTTIEIFFRRLAAAAQRGVASGAPVIIVITRYLAPEIQHMLQQMPDMPPLHNLSLRGGTVRMVRGPYRETDYAILRRLRYTSLPSPSLWVQKPEMEARRISRIAPQAKFLIVTEGLPTSAYWPGIAALFKVIKAEGIDVLVLTSSWVIALAAKAAGIPATIPRLPLMPLKDADFEERVQRFLDIVRQLAASDRVDPPAQAAMLWLGSPQRQAELNIAFETGLIVEHTLRYTGARAVLVQPHWSNLAMTATIAAHRLGTPVISAPTMTVASNHASILGWEHIDIIPCYGNQCVVAFEGMGVAKEKLPVIGNLSYDGGLQLSRQDARHTLQQRHKVRLPRRSKIILVATSSIDANEIDWISTLATFCAERGDTGLFVKLHPSFQSREEAMRARLPEDICTINATCPITEAIAASDIVVTDYSSVGAQARIMGKKLVVVNMARQRFPANDYVTLGIAENVDSIDTLRRVFADALDHPEPEETDAANRFIEAYNHPNDGKAAERLCRLILALRKPTPQESPS